MIENKYNTLRRLIFSSVQISPSRCEARFYVCKKYSPARFVANECSAIAKDLTNLKTAYCFSQRKCFRPKTSLYDSLICFSSLKKNEWPKCTIQSGGRHCFVLTLNETISVENSLSTVLLKTAMDYLMSFKLKR